MAYATRHVCTLFNVSPETVRTWAEEFAEYLSRSANPGGGRHRQFTEDDMRVLALVSEMKRDNMMYADIHATLKTGQRGAPPPLPASEVQALVVSERETQILAQVQKLQERIAELQQERDTLLPYKDENIRLKERLEVTEMTTQRRITELASQLEKAQEEIKKLNREIGRLESQLDEDA